MPRIGWSFLAAVLLFVLPSIARSDVLLPPGFTAPEPNRRGGDWIPYESNAGKIVAAARATVQDQPAIVTTWRPVALPARSFAAAVYDPFRKVGILVAGNDGIRRGDSWDVIVDQPDSAAYRYLPPANEALPPPRSSHSVAYDPTTRTVFLFGGLGGSPSGASPLSDLWTLSRSGKGNWQLVVPHTAAVPAARYQSGLAFDAVRGRLFVFGGADNSTQFADLWAFDLLDSAWHSVPTTGTPPSARQGMVFFKDPTRDRLVAFGGFVAATNSNSNEVWSLALSGPSAFAWQLESGVGTGPAGRQSPAAIFDPPRHRLLVFGGFDGTQRLNDLWELNLDEGGGWSPVAIGGAVPGPRNGAASYYDPDRDDFVVVGGFDGSDRYHDVWTLGLGAEGTSGWVEHTGSPSLLSPPPRGGHAGAILGSQSQLVIFGGAGNSSLLDDTWIADLGNKPSWRRITTEPHPGARWSQCGAFDSRRGMFYVFGGADSLRLNELWKFDPSGQGQWTLVNPSGNKPSPRQFASMAYDPLRDRLVLFGGNDGTNQADVWTLDPSVAPQWILEPASGGPSPRNSQSMLGGNGIVTIFGGVNGTGRLGDTWSLQWSPFPLWFQVPLALPLGVEPRSGAGLISTPGYLQAFGGTVDFPTLGSSSQLLSAFAFDNAWQVVGTTRAPTPRTNSTFEFSEALGVPVLYGGFHIQDANTYFRLGDLWTLGPETTSGDPPHVVFQVYPSSLGQGEATVVVEGIGLNPDHLEIVGPGASVTSQSVETKSTLTKSVVQAHFDLTGFPVGPATLIIANPGEDLVASIAIEPRREAQMTVQVLGPSGTRPGRAPAYDIVVRNSGNIDAGIVPLWIRGIPPSLKWTLDPAPLNPPDNGGPPVDWDTLATSFDGDGETIVPLIVPRVPSGGSTTVRLAFETLPFDAPTGFRLRAYTNRPLLDEFRPPPIKAGHSTNGQISDCASSVGGAIVGAVAERLPQFIPGARCGASIGQLFADGVLNVYDATSATTEKSRTYSSIKLFTDAVVDGLNAGLQCATDVDVPVSIALTAVTAVYAGLSKEANAIKIAADCLPLFEQPEAQSSNSVETVNARDPNEKYGSTDSDGGPYVPKSAPVDYTIAFENVAKATAPAQDVFVSDVLDVASLDGGATEFIGFGFGSTFVPLPPGTRNFQQDVDLRPSLPLLVRASGSFDPATGAVYMALRSIDPATGTTPKDPFLGFLPPNVNSPEGEGRVILGTRLLDGVPSGTTVNNAADIVFDVNPLIRTNLVSNVVDSEPPVSAVTGAGQVDGTGILAVQWGGNDGVSGIQDYSIFVSVDKGPFALWRSHTTAVADTFQAEDHHQYAFYSIARDRVGNVEDAPGAPDVTTDVVGTGPGFVDLVSDEDGVRIRWFAGTQFSRLDVERIRDGGDWEFLRTIEVDASGMATLVEPRNETGAPVGYRVRARSGTPWGEIWVDPTRPGSLAALRLGPNPSRGFLRLQGTLPRVGAATVDIFDLQGRLVRRTILDASSGPVVDRNVGERLASGVYVVRISQGPESISRKIVVLGRAP